MTQDAYVQYCAFEEQLKSDEELQQLTQRLQAQAPLLVQALSQLSPMHRQAVHEYLGICGEIDQRILEIASFSQSQTPAHSE